MGRLWRNEEGSREGKYLVLRRDGSTPEWPFFVLAAADPAAPHALDTYADAAQELGMDPLYCEDIRALSDEFETWRGQHPVGDPDAPRHRKDNPRVISMMRIGLLNDGPALGLATTRELLQELAARGRGEEMQQGKPGAELYGHAMVTEAQTMLANLPQDVLNYRTVDSS